MKNLKGLITLVTLLSLSSCNVNIFYSGSDLDSESPTDYESSTFISSDELSSNPSDSESSILSSSSQISESESTSESISESASESISDSTSEEVNVDVTPTNFYTINEDGVSERYLAGNTFKINSWTNFIVVDNQGRIVYTVANAGCGYGNTNDNSFYCHPYYEDKVASYITEGYFEVPYGCEGYSISYDAYGTFANEVTDGRISKNEFEDYGYGDAIKEWNSLNNQYFDLFSGVVIGEESETNLVVKNAEIFRLSSICDTALEDGTATYKVYAPYTDTYKLSYGSATAIEVYDENKKMIASATKQLTVNLVKDQIVYVSLKTTANKFFTLQVELEKNSVELPYEINSSVDMSKLKTTSSSSASPMVAAKLNYKKRSDDRGLYVNSNNPENLTNYQNKYGSIMNTVLMRQDVTEKDVFFTFEHNNLATNYYYGYRVTNTGDSDVYITVKNLGYQVNGAGSWLGEDEWIKFYNTKFITDTSKYTSSQKANYDAYVGFSNSYNAEKRKPITYRLPKGKYIYVMGGTTLDAYQKINVFNSANRVVNGGCSNGAVLFSVTGGNAEASFMIYKDADASTINNTDYVKGDKQIGYVSDDHFGVQYGGYDNCHGVVDADIFYEFNDATPSDYLPIAYTNPYAGTASSGTPYSKFTGLKSVDHYAWTWWTHIGYFDNNKAVGTDMTNYINVDYKTKKKIEINAYSYDGRGKYPNIGNWMVDYIDTFTLVNQGNKEREFTYTMNHTGVILAFVRDENGFIDDSYTPKYCIKVAKSTYGDAIEDTFEYTVKVPAHSIVRFSVDYNLLANSNGTISHRVYLK